MMNWNYQAPRWTGGKSAFGRHAQTILSSVTARSHDSSDRSTIIWHRERWDTPDQDFIDVDRLGASSSSRPLLVMFHGLEGNRSSKYIQAFAHQSKHLDWHFAMPNFRGCSGEINRAPRAYHAGDYEEVHWILQRFRREHAGPILVAGVSLGGSALLRWLEESGSQATQTVHAACAISVPLDLVQCGDNLDQGINRLIYTRNFLRTMKKKACLKLEQYPGLFDAEALRHAQTLRDYDNVFTAPLHGFQNTDDYWRRASSKPHLHTIQQHTLIVSALNDPFVPSSSLPPTFPHAFVQWSRPMTGGHAGFISGAPPRGHVMALPQRVTQWFSQHL